MYSCILDVSSWIVASTLTSPRLPSFRLEYSLRMLDLGWNPPCMRDSDQEVVFVSERSARRRSEDITIDQVRRLDLQRDIDLQSQPEHPDRLLRKVASPLAVKPKATKMEENNVETKKRRKKGQKYSEETKSFTSGDTTHMGEEEKKKRKAGKKETEEGSSERRMKKRKNTDKDVEEDKKVFKKERKEMMIEEETAETLLKKEKKKKQKRETFPNEEEEKEDKDTLKKAKQRKKHILSGETEQTQGGATEKKKQKKVKNKTFQLEPEDVKEEKEEEVKTRKKNTTKSVKKRKHCPSEDGVIEETEEENPTTKKKRKARTEDGEAQTNESKRKKRKDKKENGSEAAEMEEKAEQESDRLCKKKKDKLAETGNGETECRERRKKEKNRTALVEYPGELKKKKKRAKISAGGDYQNGEESRTEAADVDGRKSTKKDTDTSVRIKGEWAEPKDVVFLSEKSGNTDEIDINQERRRALQMEVEKASQPTELGQWSTAHFDSTQQQQKFLRLMGGFKKGVQTFGASSGSANMAMGQKEQSQLQQGLLGEFERAQLRRMDFNKRGVGLGFTPASNKKFSIDISARRSVRFDD
uniref:Small acidic protein-like domain-containing protein n=1 Tax=Oryzias latipes TaxID=8090 RepID=A0A3P9LVC2_ORYLA